MLKKVRRSTIVGSPKPGEWNFTTKYLTTLLQDVSNSLSLGGAKSKETTYSTVRGLIGSYNKLSYILQIDFFISNF